MKTRLAALALLFSTVGSYCVAQTFRVDTLQKTGPLNQRINVVILGDGFTESELPKFDTEARKFAAFFLDYSPFTAYRDYFNLYSIRVPSNESGATNPGTAPDRNPSQPVGTKDTYFGSSFGTANIDRLVAITKYEAFTNVMAQNFPSYDLAVVIVNSPYYGGSGGGIATFTLHESASLIGVHEIGHTFSFLTDEYWAGAAFGNETANQTRDTNPATIKWKKWLNQFNIGIFQHTGDAAAAEWYKPTSNNCLMEVLNRPFCAVCREATSNRILQLVKSVETVQPAPDSRVVVGAESARFQLGLLLPRPNTLRVQWRLNGALLDQKAAQLSVSNSQLPEAVNELSVSVLDTTEYIRLGNHPQQHTYAYRWTLERANLVKILAVSASKAVICSGQSTTLTAQDCIGSVTWSTGATGTSLSVSPTQSTMYSAVCAIPNAASQTAKVDIKVNPLPTAAASNTGPYLEGQTVQLNATGGATYQWNGPNNFASAQQNPTISTANVGSAGNYVVMVASAEGCIGSAQTTVTISPILSTPAATTNAVSVFPNPAKEFIQVRSSLSGEQRIVLLDVTGREVFSKSFVQSTEINTSALPDNLYFYRIGNGQESVTGKVLISPR